MSIEDFPVNLLSVTLSDYDIGKQWSAVNFDLEKYLLEEGFHSINEVPQGDEPIDNKKLDEEFVWLPWSEGNARIIVILPLSDNKSKYFEKFKSRLILSYLNEIVGIARLIGVDFDYEYYQFDFGCDLVPIGSILHYDNKKVLLMEPARRLGNGIKERFLAEGGAGLQLNSGGAGGSKNGNPLGFLQGFLWKPVSDSTGKLAILYPASIGKGTVYVNGEAGSYGGRGNGDREHYRFSKPGAAYGNDVNVTGPFGTCVIPYGALRWEN